MKLLNHGIEHELLDEVGRVTKERYKKCTEKRFLEFAGKTLDYAGAVIPDIENIDWESTFFVRHLPESNLSEITDLSDDYRFCLV